MNPNIPHTLVAKQKWLIATLLLSLLLTFLVLLPSLFDKYQVPKDMQNFYWMARYQDPALFSTDYLLADHLLEIELWGTPLLLYPASLGYGLLFYLSSFILDHIWFSKWLIFALMPISIFYLFKFGKVLGGDLAAVSLSFIFVFFMMASYQSISLASGLQRSFAVPLLLIFSYYMLQKQYRGAGVLIVLSALFYFPMLPLTLLTYAFSFITIQTPFKISLNINWAKLFPLIISLLISILLVALELAIQFEDFVPRDVPILEDPNFQSGGAAPLFISFPWLGRAGIFDAGTDLINFIVLSILGVAIYKVLGRQSWRRLPLVYWHLLIASIVMYAASFFFLVGLSSSILYQPSRYTRASLFLLIICFVGLNWPDFLEKAPLWFRRRVPLLIFFVVTLLVALGLVYLFLPDRLLLPLLFWFSSLILSGILVVLGGSGYFWLSKFWPVLSGTSRFFLPLVIGGLIIGSGVFYINTLSLRFINPSEAERDVYEFVSSLPKDAFLAGDPVIMSGIPLFSQRSVLFRDLHPNANPNVSMFILDYFEAQYAESPDKIVEFCQRYKVTHLVLDTTDFTPEYLAQEEFFYQPWNDPITELVRGRSDFVLPEIQPIFASGPFVVIECNPQTILAAR